MKRSPRIGFLVAALAAVAAFSPNAGAATTLGSDLSRPALDGIFCASVCTHVQSVIPGRETVAPSDGVIVRWRVRTDMPGGPFALKVARPVGGTDRFGAGTTAYSAAASAGVNEFPARLPIKAGDSVGINFTSANTAKFKSSPSPVGSLAPYFTPELVDGTTRTPSIINSDTELLFNADIEPDADGDGYGDETQDGCPGSNGPANGCDVTAPQVTTSVAAKQKAKQLKAYVTSSEAGKLKTVATVAYRSGGKKKTIRSRTATVNLLAATRTRAAVKFSSKSLKKLLALIDAGKRPKAKVTLTVTDAAGNATTATKSVKLKR